MQRTLVSKSFKATALEQMLRVAIISLKRTQERDGVSATQSTGIRKCEQLRIEGIDGITLLDSNINTRLITTSARKSWMLGPLVGLSHRLCWRMCCESGTPLVVLEDDVLLVKPAAAIKLLIHARMVLLGWNLTQCCEPNSVIKR